MASDILQKEVAGLSEADISSLVEDEPRKRKIGFISDAFVSIAPDFEDTPECMRFYV